MWRSSVRTGETKGRQWVPSGPAVMMGKPPITGARITGELILEELAIGEAVLQIVEAHPGLMREDIQATLAFSPQALWADVQ